MAISRVATHIWFTDKALEAAELYVSLIEGSSIDQITYYPLGVEGMRQGTVMTVELQIRGQQFIFLNGGDVFPLTSAVSIYLQVDTQDELDRYWNELVKDGGKEVQCGWLEDKFGLSWQVIPRRLDELLRDPDLETSQRVMQAMLKMTKIEVPVLEAAANRAA